VTTRVDSDEPYLPGFELDTRDVPVEVCGHCDEVLRPSLTSDGEILVGGTLEARDDDVRPSRALPSRPDPSHKDT